MGCGSTLVDHEQSHSASDQMLSFRLLDQDERNFMGWAYRRFIIRLAGIAAEEEAKYAADLINNNFSNYSAWHARTTLLHAVHGAPQVRSLSQLVAETELSQQHKPDAGVYQDYLSSHHCALIQFGCGSICGITGCHASIRSHHAFVCASSVDKVLDIELLAAFWLTAVTSDSRLHNHAVKTQQTR